MQTCACCGYQTIKAKGDYEICPICFWEDDPVQEADPWFEGGANQPSLFQSQINFRAFGAMEQRFIDDVRPVHGRDQKDPNWRLLTADDKIHATTPRHIEAVWGTAEQLSYNYWERNPKGKP